MATDLTVGSMYQGVEIIAVQTENIPCRHPRWGNDKERLAKLEGGSLLLLADGTEVIVCNDCHFNGLTGTEPYVKPADPLAKTQLQQANSVGSHRGNTHNRSKPHRPLYTDDQIKIVIKVFLKWLGIRNSTGVHNWAEQAAEELNKLHFKPRSAERWTSSMVGGLARRNINRPEFKNVKAGPVTEAEIRALGPAAQAALQGNAQPIPYRHTPVDFKKIIEAKAQRLSGPGDAQEEELVAARPDPKFSYAADDPAQASRTLAVGIPQQPKPSSVMLTHAAVPGAMAATGNHVAPWEKPAPASDYQHVTEQANGTPVFLYKDKLMYGTEVPQFS